MSKSMASIDQLSPDFVAAYAEWLGVTEGEAYHLLKNEPLRDITDEDVTAAGWDEAKHPREPEGTEKGGEFAPKKGAFMPQGQLVTPFGTFGGEAVVAHDQPDPELDKKIITGIEQLQRQGKIQKGDAYYSITSPNRRTAGTMALARAIYHASGDDLTTVARVMDSGAGWGANWSGALDEWDAVQQLTGAEPPKQIKEAMKRESESSYGRKPLSENDLNGYRARQQWYQDQFRAAYGDEGVEVFRGITGKRAMKPWVEAGQASREKNVSQLTEEYRKRPPKYEWNEPRDNEYAALSDAYRDAMSDPVEGGVWPISSWSEDRSVASEFAYGPKGRKPGVVLSTRIRPSDIWMIPVFGGQGVMRFTDVSGEHVVVTPTGKREARVAEYRLN